MDGTTETSGAAGDVEKTADQVKGAGTAEATNAVLADKTVGEDVTAFLKSIEADALALLKKIEAIPKGIVHGWHTLGAEIASRKL